MMDPLEINEMGELIRKRRKERKLRLEDLADEHISPATISNIERGVPHVNPDKIQYLMDKLDLDMDNISKLIVNEQKQLQKLRFQLTAIETMQDMGHSREAVRRLDELDLEDNHPFSPIYYLIKGRHYLDSGRYRRAERSFFNVIRLSNLTPHGQKSNLEATGYYELGRVNHAQNLLSQALQYVDNGLQAFKPDGDHGEIRFKLYQSKALYLETMNRVGEAIQVVDHVWKDLSQTRDLDTLLRFYRIRTDLLCRIGMTEEAMEIAKEGLEIARHNCINQRTFELWCSLGSVYLTKTAWDEAELCYNLALKLRGKIEDESAIILIFTRLGILYMNQGKWEQGEKMLSEAIALGDRLAHYPLLIEALMATGTFYHQRGESQYGLPYFEKAFQLSKRYGTIKKQYMALFHLAQCCEKLDRQKFAWCMRELYEVQRNMKDVDLNSLETII